MMPWFTLETIGLLTAVLFLIYYYCSSKLNYWQKRGVNGPKPLPFVGNFKDVYLTKASSSDVFVDAYYKFKNEPVIGVFEGFTPLLILRDPDLMKDVLIKDFSTFIDRTPPPSREVEPLSLHLFRLEGEKWRPLRARLSPVFSSGKLKEMFPLVLECADHFEKYLNKLVENGDYIDCREIAAKYTTDVIGSCAFGIDINSLETENNVFRKMGREIFKTDWKTVLRFMLRNHHFLLKLFAPYILNYEILHFFKHLTKETIDYRIKNNIRRHDFVDALINLKQNPGNIDPNDLTDMYLTAQAFVFFIAGFETSSITICNALYELALNPSVQQNLRAEIKNVLQSSNGEITYDSIKEMKYLHACFQETLRKYPVLLWLTRLAGSNYTFSGTKVTIEKGQQVILPVYAYQHNPEIYPEPEVFDPNRFLDENVKTRHPMFFLPFGDGPRNCIGARFANIQSKVALIKILSKFKIDVCDKTPKKYNIDKKTFLLQPTEKIYLKFTAIKN